MSFFAPQFGIRHYDAIPVICDGCGHTETWEHLSQETKEALIAATALHSLSDERELLERTAILVSRFPNTTHPLLIHKLDRQSIAETERDNHAVDHELNDDPELRTFLDSGFGLVDRTKWVDCRLNELQQYRNRQDIQCRRCAGFMYLPDSFYIEVGLYIERLAEDDA